jgi:tetratricopeptide (TPR) repeat protein
MSNKEKNQTDGNLQEVENALTSAEQFFENNQKIITIVFGAAVVVAALFLSLHRFYTIPREQRANEQMYVAEQYFEKDSFNLALNGDGNYPGFLDIMDDFGGTKSADLAQYYTGVSYLRLGQFEDAIDYLEDFDTDDALVGPVAIGACGDAYAELGDSDNAVKCYIKAANKNENAFTAPIYLLKAGKLYEILGESDKALKAYSEIKGKYPESTEGRQIDKYIARIQN